MIAHLNLDKSEVSGRGNSNSTVVRTWKSKRPSTIVTILLTDHPAIWSPRRWTWSSPAIAARPSR